MNTTEVKVLSYNRLVRGLGKLSPEEFVEKVSSCFKITFMADSFKLRRQQEIGMYMAGGWYKLQPLPGLINYEDPVDQLGVSILQDHILKAILNITDPRTDTRLTFESGLTPIKNLQVVVDRGTFQIAFFLHPISIFQLIKVADANRIMPPKSTWVEPKFPVGLLTSSFS
jgi:uncharacterized protein (DUF1015 family)